MKIKKIAIMHPTFGYNGGAENVILATAKHFYEKYNIESTIYTYKTNKDYKKGQIVHIIGPSGLNRVMIINPALKEAEIKFPIDKIKLLEEA